MIEQIVLASVVLGCSCLPRIDQVLPYVQSAASSPLAAPERLIDEKLVASDPLREVAMEDAVNLHDFAP